MSDFADQATLAAKKVESQVGRTYAGVLGSLAFTAVAARGLVHGGTPDSVLPIACGWMFGFALLGFIAGELAGWIVEESVRANLVRAAAARQQADAAAKK